MIRPERARAAVEDPPEPRDGLRRLPGRHQRLTQVAAHHEGFQAAGTENPFGVRGEFAPVGDGRAGQPGAVHALPGQHQQRVTAAIRPEHVPGDLPEADGARPQVRGQPRPRLLPGPDLEQRIRRGPDRPVIEVLGHGRADRRLDHRAYPDGRRRARRIDGHQPGLLQAENGVPCPLRIRRLRDLAHHELAGRLGGEHGARYPVPVKQRGQRHQRPDAHARRQVFGVLGRKRPGDRGRRRLGPARVDELLLPLREVLPVVAAGHARASDHRAGLAQRERLAAEVPNQVYRSAALVRVGAEAAG